MQCERLHNVCVDCMYLFADGILAVLLGATGIASPHGYADVGQTQGKKEPYSREEKETVA